MTEQETAEKKVDNNYKFEIGEHVVIHYGMYKNCDGRIVCRTKNEGGNVYGVSNKGMYHEHMLGMVWKWHERKR